MSLSYQQLASDLLVLTGVALALLSIILVITALARTRAPRGGAIALSTGILLIAIGAWGSIQPVTPYFALDAWTRVTSPKSAPGPAPLPDETTTGAQAAD